MLIPEISPGSSGLDKYVKISPKLKLSGSHNLGRISHWDLESHDLIWQTLVTWSYLM